MFYNVQLGCKYKINLESSEVIFQLLRVKDRLSICLEGTEIIFYTFKNPFLSMWMQIIVRRGIDLLSILP